MKSAAEVLMMKERELQKVKKEVEALRIAAQLLAEDKASAEPAKARSMPGMPLS